MKFLWIFISAIVALLSCFSTPVYSMDVTLGWDTDSRVDGYKLYYKARSSGPPYNGTGAAEGDSPVDVGWVSEFTLRALSDDEVYYFVATAYNDLGESGYSNEVSTDRSISSWSSSIGVVDSNSGAGCFISTILWKPASGSNYRETMGHPLTMPLKFIARDCGWLDQQGVYG